MHIFKSTLLVGPDLLYNLMFVLSGFKWPIYAVFSVIDDTSSAHVTHRYMGTWLCKKTKKDNISAYHKTAAVVFENFSMDDCLELFKGIEQALKVNRDSVHLGGLFWQSLSAMPIKLL